MRSALRMTRPAPIIEDDESAAEAQALAAAIGESDADPRTAPHEEVHALLLRLPTASSTRRHLKPIRIEVDCSTKAKGASPTGQSSEAGPIANK